MPGQRKRTGADPGADLRAGSDDPDHDRRQAAADAWQRVGQAEGEREERQRESIRQLDRAAPAAHRQPPASRRPAAEVRVTPRAGILVTGTEVLTGIISDRNGPWLSERLGELGVDASTIQIVGNLPEDLLS